MARPTGNGRSLRYPLASHQSALSPKRYHKRRWLYRSDILSIDHTRSSLRRRRPPCPRTRYFANLWLVARNLRNQGPVAYSRLSRYLLVEHCLSQLTDRRPSTFWVAKNPWYHCGIEPLCVVACTFIRYTQPGPRWKLGSTINLLHIFSSTIMAKSLGRGQKVVLIDIILARPICPLCGPLVPDLDALRMPASYRPAVARKPPASATLGCMLGGHGAFVPDRYLRPAKQRAGPDFRLCTVPAMAQCPGRCNVVACRPSHSCRSPYLYPHAIEWHMPRRTTPSLSPLSPWLSSFFRTILSAAVPFLLKVPDHILSTCSSAHKRSERARPLV